VIPARHVGDHGTVLAMSARHPGRVLLPYPADAPTVALRIPTDVRRRHLRALRNRQARRVATRIVLIVLGVGVLHVLVMVTVVAVPAVVAFGVSAL